MTRPSLPAALARRVRIAQRHRPDWFAENRTFHSLKVRGRPLAEKLLPCFLVQRAFLSFGRFLAGFFSYSSGVLPAFTASFSSLLLRCLSTGDG
jgi:hypothetical protein